MTIEYHLASLASIPAAAAAVVAAEVAVLAENCRPIAAFAAVRPLAALSVTADHYFYRGNSSYLSLFSFVYDLAPWKNAVTLHLEAGAVMYQATGLSARQIRIKLCQLRMIVSSGLIPPLAVLWRWLAQRIMVVELDTF